MKLKLLKPSTLGLALIYLGPKQDEAPMAFIIIFLIPILFPYMSMTTCKKLTEQIK